MTDTSKKFSRFASRLWLVIAIVAAIVLAGISLYYIERTVVTVWKAVVLAAMPALAVSVIILRRPAADILATVIRYSALWFFLTTLLLCTAMAANYHLADASTLHSETVIIESRHTEVRYHTRRVRRGVTRRGEPYNVYYVTARFPDGSTKRFSVTLSRYNATRAGSKATIDTARGLLGLPILLPHIEQNNTI